MKKNTKKKKKKKVSIRVLLGHLSLVGPRSLDRPPQLVGPGLSRLGQDSKKNQKKVSIRVLLGHLSLVGPRSLDRPPQCWLGQDSVGWARTQKSIPV